MNNSLMRVTVSELCERQGVNYRLVMQLVELEIAYPVEGDRVENWVFDATGALWLEKALRLQRELELDWVAIGMLIDLMRQRERLRRENEGLRRQLSRFFAS
ncbi:MAG: chaperone modulator CbpM [Halioglobus sp.]|nr:chaperone modulator CbpM [Halioglobus sp.]